MDAGNWIRCSSGAPLPRNAVLAGHDIDCTPIYVGRACHEGELLPAKVIPSKQGAFVCYDGHEFPKGHYEVLCHANVTWVQSGFGSVPPNAIVGGRTSYNEPLYIGRALYKGSLTPGKVHPSHQMLYIPFGGSEISMQNYEVLIEN